MAGVDSAGALAELQAWYHAQCDGDWEHQAGIRIGTLDNPGWKLSIDLEGTDKEGAAFEELRDLDPDRDWIHCFVKEQKFEGRGGPHMLERMIRVFLEWAAQPRPRRR